MALIHYRPQSNDVVNGAIQRIVRQLQSDIDKQFDEVAALDERLTKLEELYGSKV